jgi:hypothetical protein
MSDSAASSASAAHPLLTPVDILFKALHSPDNPSDVSPYGVNLKLLSLARKASESICVKEDVDTWGPSSAFRIIAFALLQTLVGREYRPSEWGPVLGAFWYQEADPAVPLSLYHHYTGIDRGNLIAKIVVAPAMMQLTSDRKRILPASSHVERRALRSIIAHAQVPTASTDIWKDTLLFLQSLPEDENGGVFFTHGAFFEEMADESVAGRHEAYHGQVMQAMVSKELAAVTKIRTIFTPHGLAKRIGQQQIRIRMAVQQLSSIHAEFTTLIENTTMAWLYMEATIDSKDATKLAQKMISSYELLRLTLDNPQIHATALHHEMLQVLVDSLYADLPFWLTLCNVSAHEIAALRSHSLFIISTQTQVGTGLFHSTLEYQRAVEAIATLTNEILLKARTYSAQDGEEEEEEEEERDDNENNDDNEETFEDQTRPLPLINMDDLIAPENDGSQFESTDVDNWITSWNHLEYINFPLTNISWIRSLLYFRTLFKNNLSLEVRDVPLRFLMEASWLTPRVLTHINDTFFIDNEHEDDDDDDNDVDEDSALFEFASEQGKLLTQEEYESIEQAHLFAPFTLEHISVQARRTPVGQVPLTAAFRREVRMATNILSSHTYSLPSELISHVMSFALDKPDYSTSDPNDSTNTELAKYLTEGVEGELMRKAHRLAARQAKSVREAAAAAESRD